MYMSLLAAVLCVVVCRYCYGRGGGGGAQTSPPPPTPLYSYAGMDGGRGGPIVT
jgi:hypothetical protein